MKILHVTPSYEPAWHLGGVIRSISQLSRALVRLGHDVTIFTTDSGRDCRMVVPINQKVMVEGVEVYYFKTNLSLKYAYSRSLAKACHVHIKDFDIVHIISFWCYPGIPASKAALLHDVPFLVSPFGTLIQGALRDKIWKKYLYFNLVEKRIINRAHAIRYETEFERETMAFHKFEPPSFILPTGYEIREFQEICDSTGAKRRLRIEPHQRVITFLGRLHPIKSLDLLIRAVAHSSLQDIDLLLLLAGPDGGIERDLRQLAISLGVDNRVRFLGKIDPKDRNKLFAASDIVALVSRHENFGNAAVEAMLAGVPVLLSEHVGNCRDALADGAGMVVPLQVESIAQALTTMLSNPDKLAAMGRAAVVAAQRRYDITLISQQMATAYADIITGRRSGGLSWSET